jgi:hypothetical protein
VHSDTVSAQLHRLNWLLRARVVKAKLHELKRAVKAGFDPNQPQVPADSGRTSGQWTGGGGSGGGSGSQLAQNVPRGGGGGSYRLRSGRLVEPTPAEEARLVATEAEVARLRRQVQEVDPVWEPRESLSTPDSIEGDIAAAEGEAREAETRLFELAQQPPENYPTVMNTEKIGGFPNNAVFHAEATCLLRAARVNGGSLAGQTIEVQADRAICGSCRTVLPYIGLQLGNPTVIFTDPSGRVRIMRDGIWIK